MERKECKNPTEFDINIKYVTGNAKNAKIKRTHYLNNMKRKKVKLESIKLFCKNPTNLLCK